VAVEAAEAAEVEAVVEAVVEAAVVEVAALSEVVVAVADVDGGLMVDVDVAVVAVAVAVVVVVVAEVAQAERASKWSLSRIVTLVCSLLLAKTTCCVPVTWWLVNPSTVKSVSLWMDQMRAKRLSTACGTLSAPSWQPLSSVVLNPFTWVQAPRFSTSVVHRVPLFPT
jgi:hypothetical protein